MQTFRLIYLRNGMLDDTQVVEVRSVLDAVQRAAGADPDVRIEIWSDERRVAVVEARDLHRVRMLA